MAVVLWMVCVWGAVIPQDCPPSFLLLFSDFLHQRKHFSPACTKMLPLFCFLSMRHECDVSAPYCQAFLFGGVPLFL